MSARNRPAAYAEERRTASVVAMLRLPDRPPYRHRIVVGHHSRAECLSRPWEWCRAIGNHAGRCSRCPIPEARDAD